MKYHYSEQERCENMNEKPLISVITPTYNRAHLLPRAVTSVLNQTYQNFELIIIDDGSNDGTQDVVRTFSDTRIRFIRYENNKGLSAAMNIGWDSVRGRYVCKLDDDDELMPDALETLIDKFSELSSEGVGILRFDCIDAETGNFSGTGIREEGYIRYNDVLCGKIQGDYGMTIDMAVLGNNRLDEQWWSGNIILWLRLHRKTKAYYIPKALYKAYRNHGERFGSPGGWIKQIPRVTLTKAAFLNEFGEELKLTCPELYKEKLVDLGISEILNGETTNGRGKIREFLIENFSIKFLIFYMLSFFLSKAQLQETFYLYTRFISTFWR